VYADKTLTCRDCGVAFIFTAGEQEFFALKGLMNEPGRCPPCRAARKAERDGGALGGMDARPRREMHTTVCAECGAEALVPFLPRGDRPVYCSACFDRSRAGAH
jgi:CxxC-x17-CxxC domain-containing protein